MGQIARQLANGFRDILLGMRKDDIGKNDIDAPIDFGEVNPLFKTTVSSEGEDRLIKEGQILDPYTAEDRMRYPIAEGFPVKDEYNFDNNFEPRFYSGSKSEILTREEVADGGDAFITYDFQRFEPEGNNPNFAPVVNNPRIGPRGDDLTITSDTTPESASTELMPFYSTIESSLRSLNIKNTGMLGKQIKQKLSKVKHYNEEEAAFIGFNLADNTTYTNKDLNKLLEDKGIIVTANIKTKSDTLNRLKKENYSVDTIYDADREWSYSQTQRQNIKNVINDKDLAQKYPDNPSDSFELSINVNPVFVKGSDTYEGRANFINKNIGITHSINREAGPTLAHARGDVYTTHDGTKEILMSEFQTDAMRSLKGPEAVGYSGFTKNAYTDIPITRFPETYQDPFAFSSSIDPYNLPNPKKPGTIIENPGFVERKLPIPTGRYSAPERYLEKLLQSIIVYAKREGIDTIRIPAPFDIGKERGLDFLKGSVLKDNYIISMDRALKNITKEEPKIKVKRTQRENPYKGKREEWENDEDIDVDFGDYLFDTEGNVNEGDTVDDILRGQGYFNDGGPLDEDFIPNVENADDLATAGIFQDADRETVDLATGNVNRIGTYKPGPEEKIWDKSKPRFKEMIAIDIKGLKLVNIEGLKGRYAKGGLVTAPSNGLMSR